jgi:signal transduction histidine kinase
MNRLAIIGIVIVLVFVLVAIFAPWIAHYDVGTTNLAMRYMPPSAAHWFGTDELGMVANVLDHTARELGAQLTGMARERAHTDAILTGMAEGVLLIARNGHLVLTNPAARTMLRLPAETGDTHYVELVRHPHVCRLVAAALAGESPAPVEVQLDAAGPRTFVAHSVPVAAARGGGAVLVLRDITDLRRADQVRRDFVANVSHELRTPLTAIRGYVEALQDSPGSPEQTRQFLEIIDRHSLRMERLVRDLLRLARLDAGLGLDERGGDLAERPQDLVVDLQIPGGPGRHQRAAGTTAREVVLEDGHGLAANLGEESRIEDAARADPASPNSPSVLSRKILRRSARPRNSQ